VVVKAFESPNRSLGALDAEAAARLIAASCDVSLAVDHQGVIRDIAFGSDELANEGFAKWVGQPWIDTVTVESRPKIEGLLEDASATTPPRWRHVNHPSSLGADIPVQYFALRVGEGSNIIVIGRSLRKIAETQQRLVGAQQSMERDYWRVRHLETRYRLLFQMATEAVLIVDAATRKIVEANPAANQLFGNEGKSTVDRSFLDSFDEAGVPLVETLLAQALTAGKAEEVRVRLAGAEREFDVSASLLKQDNASYFLVRLAAREGRAVPAHASEAKAQLLQIMESSPDGVVVTDREGRILSANAAFLEMVQLTAEEQARGEYLDNWLGRPGVDFNVLVANLRQHGSVRLYATSLRGEHGPAADIEISAVSVQQGSKTSFGFIVRNVSRRIDTSAPAQNTLPRSVEQMTELVGRVALKDLVRDATELIERLCIEAALELTDDNRASAAEMLGLSRQSLYVKLRRYGLGDLSAPEEVEQRS